MEQGKERKGDICCYKGNKKTKKKCTKTNPEPPCIIGYKEKIEGRGNNIKIKNIKLKKPYEDIKKNTNTTNTIQY